MATSGSRAAPRFGRRLRAAALLLALGYAALTASLLARNAVLLTVLIPAGMAFMLAGIVLWFAMVVAEARSKGMV